MTRLGRPPPEHGDPQDRPDEPQDGTADRAAGDRRTLDRARRAGILSFGASAAAGVTANAAFGGDGAAAMVWVTSAVVVGALVTAGWLVLALVLDLLAGVVPGRRRVVWTAVAFAAAFVSPVLPAAALQVAAAREVGL